MKKVTIYTLYGRFKRNSHAAINKHMAIDVKEQI